MQIRHSRRLALLGLTAALALAGCGQGRPTITGNAATALPAPTLSSIFVPQPTLTEGPTDAPTITPVPTPQPTSNPTVVAQATNAALREDQLEVVSVFNDTLSSDWSLKNSFQTTIDLKSTEYTAQGRYSIKAQPKLTTGVLYFTLNKTAKEQLRRDRVQAVRFYLSGGDEALNNKDLVVTVVGSNAQPYWVADDQSVQIEGRVTDGQPVFSETRLAFLKINTAIPPKTFVEVTVWLDELIYDPLYTYVTGFYLKTDKQSAPNFYVDQVSLLLLPKTP
jgi:hypothetical protein